jgi:hypothetical protein
MSSLQNIAGNKSYLGGECAYVVKRPLSWSVWVPGWSDTRNGSFLDRLNKEWSHEHFYFNQSGDNIGFGVRGLFSEDVSKHQYYVDSPCLDGDTLRTAINSTRNPKWYGGFFRNCQTYVARVMKKYEELSSLLKTR